jgi:hypothetical protein
MSRHRFAAVLSTVLTMCFAQAALADSDACDWFPDLSRGCERAPRFEGFVPPTSMPYLFEDPFITTEISAHGLWHDFPTDSVFEGGEIWVAAVQARIAITDRLAFIATKDGYSWLRPDGDSQISSDQGFFDITAGFKYAAIVRPEDRFIVTPALRIDIPVGNDDVFSGNGDGVIIPSVSSGLGVGPVNFIASVGLRQPLDTNDESTSIFYNLHADVGELFGPLVPFIEVNATTWTRSGDGSNKVKTKDFGNVELKTAQDVLFGAGITDSRRWEGADVVNLGSSGVSGQSVATLAVGSRASITKNVSVGAYYEFPITDRKDIFEQRVAINAIYEF